MAEEKVLPADYRSRLQLRPKRGHKERDLTIVTPSGREFRLIPRESGINPLAFSVILAYRPLGTSRLFRLRRYDGRGHEHTNLLERNRFYDFHTHLATARYQDADLPEDGYAEPTDRFADFQGAVDCLLRDCGFALPPNSRLSFL